MKLLACILALEAAVSAAAAAAAAPVRAAVPSGDFSRYEVIIGREPFGTPPPPPPPAAPPPGPPPVAFVNNLRLVAITDTSFGVKVGFLDVSKNPPKSYYLAVGRSEDGIEVVDADYDLEAALLRKGTEEHWLYMKSGPPVAGGPAAGGAMPPGAILPGATGVPGGSPMEGRISYYARRLERRNEILEERRKASAEREKIGAEQLQAQLRDYNLELIRARGEKGPPLPIPLTPQEDAQLVEEGVLPAR